MDKLKMMSKNNVDENIERIGALFPACVTEVISASGAAEKAIDFDMLKQELSSVIVEGDEERYQFTWPDKKKSILLANSPINKTLRPNRDESVDFDSTGNLYIEGDNLDVLKLLQETYMGKVKMIYIDPPYNTGNDFVYNDKFTMQNAQWDEVSGDLDDEGNRLFQNNESNGRFHTDWLNMIYPRLKVAKDLLTDDGVIFISIDDNEVDNLKKVCNEIFGIGNFVASIIVQTNPRGRTFDRFIAKTHEYILVISKNIENESCYEIPKDDKAKAGYSKKDEHGLYRLLELRNRNPVFNRQNRPLMFYPIYADPVKLDVSLNASARHTIEIFPRNSQGLDGCWTWGLSKAKKEIDLLVANLASTGKWSVFRKDYLEGSSLYTKSKALWLEKEMNHENGKEMVGKLFNKTPFDFPKSVELIKKCLLIGTSEKECIILDFFSGSATTAHAVMQLNAEDGGNRKFICVQLPEETDAKSEAFKAGYKNICEIGKERIRRAGKKVVSEYSQEKLQLKIDEYNEKQVAFSKQVGAYLQEEKEIKGRMLLVENIKKILDEKISQKQNLNMDLEGNRKLAMEIATLSMTYTTEINITTMMAKNFNNSGDRFDASNEELKEISQEIIAIKTKDLSGLDTGFRVLKLDSSNMKEVYYRPDQLSQDMFQELEGNIKPDRTPEDLLFQVMLDMGVMLDSKITCVQMTNDKSQMTNNLSSVNCHLSSENSCSIYIVGDYGNNIQPNLVCCFDDNLTDEVVTQIAKLNPLYAVFRDSSFSTDSTATNFDQIFETYSKDTVRKVI